MQPTIGYWYAQKNADGWYLRGESDGITSSCKSPGLVTAGGHPMSHPAVPKIASLIEQARPTTAPPLSKPMGRSSLGENLYHVMMASSPLQPALCAPPRKKIRISDLLCSSPSLRRPRGQRGRSAKSIETPNCPESSPDLSQKGSPIIATVSYLTQAPSPSQTHASSETSTSPPTPLSDGIMSSVPGRTPHLRHLHKMAERRRRHEMRLVFDELKKIIPKQTKHTNKWDVLAATMESIDMLNVQYAGLLCERERLVQELSQLMPLGPNE